MTQSATPDPMCLPDRPTRHLPGSLKKLLILARRARRGEFLHHNDDARHIDGERLRDRTMHHTETCKFNRPWVASAPDDEFEAAVEAVDG